MLAQTAAYTLAKMRPTGGQDGDGAAESVAINPYGQETARIYDRGTFGSRSGFGQRPALLVVDFCLGMTDPASAMGADMTEAVLSTARLLAVARAAGIVIVYTTVLYAKGCRELGIRAEKVPALRIFEEGGPWSAIDPRVENLPGEVVIEKRFPSAFFATNLAPLLIAERVDTVIVTGSTTSGCVRASAVDAYQYGFRVVIPRECVADRAPGPHVANLFDLDAKYADVVSAAEVLTQLENLIPTAVPSA